MIVKKLSGTAARGAKAFEQKQALLKILSPDGRCGNPKCRKKPRNASLEIHHIDGRDWEPRNLGRWSRVKRYWDEYRAGVRLAAWCRQCNAGVNPKRDLATASRIMNRRMRSRGEK